MRARTGGVCLAIVLASGAAGILSADQIQVGTANSLGGSTKPFGDYTVTAYQQLYSSSDFSSLIGGITISELNFFIDASVIPVATTDPTLQSYPGQYQVTLSEVDPGSISDLAFNVSTDSGASGVNSTASLDLTTDTLALTLATPFHYDPTKDLLLDVQQVGGPQWTLFALQADVGLNSAGLDAATCTSGCSYGLGLVTNFIETPDAPPTNLPEASGVPLLGFAAGLLALFAARRKMQPGAAARQR